MILLALLILLNIGDIVTTTIVLKRGGVELNPLVRWLIAKLGILPGLLLLKVASTAPMVAVVVYYPDLAWVLLIPCAITAFAVVNNTIVAVRQKAG